MTQVSRERFVIDTPADLRDINFNPIQNCEKETLVSLEAATLMLTSEIPGITEQVSIATQKCYRKSTLLTREESAAIYLYTIPGTIYKRLNYVLRTGDPSQIVPWLPFLKLFTTALKKLPSVKIRVWRGTSVDDGALFDDGDTHTWWTVNSCSKDLAVIQMFLGDTGTVFAIDAVDGKDIAVFSALPTEKEVILMPGTRVWPYCKHLNFTDKYFLIHLIQESTESDCATPTNKLLKAVRQQYLRQSRIERVINERKSFPIDQSYINLSIVESEELQIKESKLKTQEEAKKSAKALESEHSFEQHSNEILGTYEEIYGCKKIIDVKNVFERCKDSTKKILILGRAGIGKSTFCRYVSYLWAKGDIWSEYTLLILVSLRSLTKDRYPPTKVYSPVDIVQREYLPFHDISEGDKCYFEDICNNGKIVWILDGYDEFAQNCPEQLKDFFTYVREQQNHILTSRPYGVALLYDLKMEIIGFTDENIPKYVDKFFYQIKDSIESAIRASRSLLNFLRTNNRIWGIVHIPVNLELVCSLWNDSGWLENKILTLTTLYDTITEWLCRRHLQKQNKPLEDMTKNAVFHECGIELDFLEHLAYIAMEQDRVVLPSTILEEIEKITKCFLYKPPQLLNLGVLKSYDDRILSFGNAAKKAHYFVHLSFQEYFAARCLLQMLGSSSKSTAIEFINNNKYNERFSLVFVFASGILAQEDYFSYRELFWSTVQGEPMDLIGIKHAQLILTCFDEFGSHIVFSQQKSLLQVICRLLHVYANCAIPTVRHEIIQSFTRTRHIGSNPIVQNTLIELMKMTVENQRLRILVLLSQIVIMELQPELFSQVLLAFQDQDHNIKSVACEVLGNIGGNVRTNEIVLVLIGVLCNAVNTVRRKACEALGKIGEVKPTAEVITGLINALKDKDARVRSEACKAFGRISEKALTTEVRTGLSYLLQDSNAFVRIEAYRVLEKINQTALATEDNTGQMSALQVENGNDRSESYVIHQAIDNRTAVDPAITNHEQKRQDEQCIVKTFACDILERIGNGKTETEVSVSLTTELQNENTYVRSGACEAIEKLSEKLITSEVFMGLICALYDENRHVRRKACEVLGNIGGKTAMTEIITALISALRDNDIFVRLASSNALGRIGEKATTNQVITFVSEAISQNNLYIYKFEVRNAFEGLIASYNALKELDSDMIITVFTYIKHPNMILNRVSCNHFIKLYLETKRVEWAAVIAYVTLLQGAVITMIGDRIRVYDRRGLSEFRIDEPHLINALENAVHDLKREFKWVFTETNEI